MRTGNKNQSIGRQTNETPTRRLYPIRPNRLRIRRVNHRPDTQITLGSFEPCLTLIDSIFVQLITALPAFIMGASRQRPIGYLVGFTISVTRRVAGLSMTQIHWKKTPAQYSIILWPNTASSHIKRRNQTNSCQLNSPSSTYAHTVTKYSTCITVAHVNTSNTTPSAIFITRHSLSHPPLAHPAVTPTLYPSLI